MSHAREMLRRLVPAWGGRQAVRPRRAKSMQPSVDNLEARLVLSRMGALSAPSMASRAAIFARAAAGASTTSHLHGGGPGALGGVKDTQLAADLKAYQTAVNTVYQGSGVTDAERLALRDALGAVKQAGVTYDQTKLAAVADTILASLADSDASTTPESSRADFLAAFSGATSSTDTDTTLTDDETKLVNAAFDAFVTVAENLKIDSTKLSALATARAAIAADYTRLSITATPPQNLDLILGGPGFGGGPGGGGPRGSC